jgi:hypothetical protein
MANLVAIRRFHGMGDADSRSLRHDNNVRMQHFVRRSFAPVFDSFWGMCGKNSCNVFLQLFIVLWVPIFAMRCRRAMPILWHVSMFLGLWPVDFFLLVFTFWLVVSTASSIKGFL